MKRRTMLLLCAATALSATLAGTGCSNGFTIATPNGFAELEDQDNYGYRATNAEGVVLAVRREANKPYGDLGFWSGAVDAYLQRKGYQAVETVDVKSADGVAGKQVRYRTSHGDREQIFWVAVFVTGEAVVTVEAGGERDFFVPVEKSLGAAISSLTIG